MSQEDLIPLDLHSEKYSATGNLASEGMRNQLGRPKLDQLTVLMRESVQNSWDAAIPGRNSIDYDIELREATPEQRQFLLTRVFKECPHNLDIYKRLHSKATFPLLTLSDRGTSGLGGLTRADILTEEDDETPQDFVCLLYTSPSPRD